MDPNETIVISGIAGKFPECDNVEEFREALLKGIDTVTISDKRFPAGAMRTPKRWGKIKVIDKYDAAFFGVHPKQANFMDPRQRILNETVYECLIDAGINPQELRGSDTGVYVGMSQFNNIETLREEETNGYTNIGISLAMAANRISYSFDFKGPSFTLDTACSSSMYAFANALRDMKNGIIENAVVCGAQLLLHPHESLEFFKLNMLSPGGKCKVFSTTRDGYARSEAIVCVLLQKGSKSKRIYSTVLGGRINADGYKMEGVTYPSSDVQFKLMQEVYKECNVTADEVTYVETHGTGTQIGDLQECKSIVRMFCNNRKEPLPVGSVKSNMGHSECSSGLCSIAKVIIAMEYGVMPGNLHADPIDTELPGVKEGTIKIVNKNLQWDGGIAALNCFGFGGANAHIAIKSNPAKKSNIYKRPKHRLVNVSGRTEEAVNYFLDGVQANQDDEDFLALVDEIHKINVRGHNNRGYVVLGDKSKREVGKYIKDRPIWFIYTGMGAQWANMGRDLMKIEVFRNTLRRCANALKPYNIDLEDVITNSTPTTFDNITNCFCAIAAVSIALTDVLYSLGIVPDGIAGHSLGEVGCAYAEGQLTPEQAVLLAYARGYASENTKLPPGQMAAIGLTKEECQKLLPEDVFIACQNGKNSVTISGPLQSTINFVEKLKSQGIFAKLVNSAGFAYHTKYVTDAGPLLLDFLKKVLTTPKPRSPKWISSSVPESKANESWTKYNCAEYHHNNFCSTVLFDQVYQHIPENAIVIEVAPHGLLQAILKRELNPSATNISLVDRSSNDNEQFLLSSIGKIFMAGGQPNLRDFYKGVKFPVSRGTKMLAPLVKWDHSTTWYVPYWSPKDYGTNKVTVNISDENYSYLEGHTIDGRVLMPATGYLVLVWEALADMLMRPAVKIPVVIENVKFNRATVLPLNTDVIFLINITKQSGNFEIFEGGSVVASGRIWIPKDITNEFLYPEQPPVPKNTYLSLKMEDLYKECHLRRYKYEGDFQAIKESDAYGLHGKIEWKGKFISFLDAMLHMTLIAENSRDLYLPTTIQRLVIDPVEHLKQVRENKELSIFNNQDIDVVKSGGVEIIGLKSSKAPKRQQTQEEPVLETYEFVPFEASTKNQFTFDTALQIALHIILENTKGLIKSPKISEVVSQNDQNNLTSKIKNILDKQAMSDAEYFTLDSKKNTSNSYDVIVLTEHVIDQINKDKILQNLGYDGFVLYVGDFSKTEKLGLQIIFQSVSDENSVYLLRSNYKFPKEYAVVNVRNTDFQWLKKINELLASKTKDTIYLFSQGEEINGIVGLVKCLLAESGQTAFKSIFIQDNNADIFSTEDDFYRDQLLKNLSCSVFKDGNWGTFVHLPLKEIESREVANASATILTVGDLSSLCWLERPPVNIKSDSNSEVAYVFYSALNFRDVMLATGKISAPTLKEPTASEINMGLEYSGITSSGKRVMGLVINDGLGLQVQTNRGFTWDVPETWSLEEAATVPCVYATCYYAMIIRGQMQPGESILIHAGTGGIGLAAISVALSMSCEVFTTVGSPEKREYLKGIFPQLKDENIGDSRSKSFEKVIMKSTKKRGVDMVLNSLSAELFQASLRCVATRGRFLEIGKVDFFARTPIDSNMFLKNCSFHGIILEDLAVTYSSDKQRLYRLLEEGVKNGAVRPLPRAVFKETEVENAFRFLASGKHKGKVLIQIRKEEPLMLKSPIRTIRAIPRIYFDSKKSYILIGGLGGFGLELADWMIRRGATKIILNSRRNISNGYQSFCFKRWSQFNEITVKTSTEDTTTLEGAEKLISAAEKLGPVGGVFNMALELRDALIENQSKEMYEAVFKTKIISGQNMDTITRKTCPELDHFIVFSSIACGRGNAGQSNYGMANSALERLCEKRKKEKLPGLAVQWGPIGEVGYLTKIGNPEKVFDQLLAQNITSCINALEKFMLQSAPVGSSVVVDKKDFTASQGALRTLSNAIAHILGIKNIDTVDKTLTLSQQGLDSLMIAEIKQTLYRNYQLEFSAEEIRELTFSHLLELENRKKDNYETEVNDNNEINMLLPKETVVRLNGNESTKKTIFVIHPIEGHVELLNEIAQQLKAVVYGLQCTKDTDYETLQEYASYFIKQIKNIQPKGPYYVCGYSYGCAVALEIGLQLETEGEIVDIVSIEGSPAFVKNTLEGGYMRLGKSFENSKTEILYNFASSFSKVNREEVKDLLTNIKDWDQQVQAVSNLVSQKTGIDASEIALSADRYIKRCAAGFVYEPRTIFKGKMLLIRQTENPYSLSNDYDLQKICQQKVEIVKLKGDHRTILLGDNATNISQTINSFFVKV